MYPDDAKIVLARAKDRAHHVADIQMSAPVPVEFGLFEFGIGQEILTGSDLGHAKFQAALYPVPKSIDGNFPCWS
jgi:hypothetical protein